MENEKILLLDFHTDGHLGAPLRDILSSCLAEGITLISEDAGFDTADSPDETPPYLGLIAAHDPAVTYLLLSEQQLGRVSALTETLKPRWPEMPVIMIAEVGEPTRIYELLQRGVTDFITPPLRAVEILPRFWRLLEHARCKRTMFHALKEDLGLGQLIGEGPSFLVEVRKIPLIARCDASVLITGETGTGKELCARAIHYLSPRSDRPFVPVNCGAIPVELMENELFGHERGAFTGAAHAQPGLIQSADGGMLFLDEVDSLSLPAQVKLLRFLQEKEYRPLGSARTQRADVRVVAATNGDCEQMAATGKLRQDLFHRLNVIPLKLPPLRERRGDISLLARHFLEKYMTDARKPAPKLDAEAMLVLTLYDWPGNVRELKNVIVRALALCEQEFIGPQHLCLPLGDDVPQSASFQEAKASFIAQFERTYIQKLLLSCQGNISKAARAARKNRRAFWQLIRKHHIDIKGLKQSSRPE